MNGNGNARSDRTKMKRVDEQETIPTVLVIAQDGLLQALVRSLTLEGYVVLSAKNEVEAVGVVISQSRPIHILLADVNINGYRLARALKQYRPEMQALFISTHPQQSSDVLDVRTAVPRVRQLLRPVKEIAADAHWKGLAATA